MNFQQHWLGYVSFGRNELDTKNLIIYIVFFSENVGDQSNERGERFHTITEMERRFLYDISWSIQRDYLKNVYNNVL